MRTWSEEKASDVRMQSQQLLCRSDGYGKRPSLIHLLNKVERMPIDRMTANRLEFELSEDVERITTLFLHPRTRTFS